MTRKKLAMARSAWRVDLDGILSADRRAGRDKGLHAVLKEIRRTQAWATRWLKRMGVRR